MEELIALHAGPLLDDVEGEWAGTPRQTYELLYLDTLEALVALYAEEQSWTRCLNIALQGVAADPDCEAFYQAAADAYRALGKPWAAARLARRVRHRSDEVPSAG